LWLTITPDSRALMLRSTRVAVGFTNSTHDQKVVGSNLESSEMLDGNGVKAMPGSILAPNSGWLEKIRKIQVAKSVTPKSTVPYMLVYKSTRV